MPDFAKNELGRFITKGLDEKAFTRIFKHVEKLQRKNRRKARRIITPAMLKTRTVKDLLSLGRKKTDGKFYTLEDMAYLRRNRDAHAKKYGRAIAGITYAELISGSLRIDVARANNRVDDGRGITRATIVNQQNNVLRVRVKASSVSVHQDHSVLIRLEQWDELLENCEHTKAGYAKATKAACAGRVSLDCDCGRYHYWYRHLATVGNYAITPESAPPKEKNPKYEGIACKHIIKAMTMLQSASWQMLIGKQMKQQAESKRPYDDNKTHFFTGDEAKQANRNRKTTVNQDKVRREHERYTARQEALAKKLAADPDKVKKLREQATRARKQSAADKKRALAAELAAKAKQAENDALKKKMAAMQEMQKAMFLKMAMAQGKTKAQATAEFAEFAKSQGWLKQ